MFVHVPDPRPSVDLKTCPGRAGVAPLNPENVAYTVLPVASLADGSTRVTARFGSGALSMVVHVATPDPLTVDDALIRPSEAPVYSTSLPFTRFGSTPIHERYDPAPPLV